MSRLELMGRLEDKFTLIAEKHWMELSVDTRNRTNKIWFFTVETDTIRKEFFDKIGELQYD